MDSVKNPVVKFSSSSEYKEYMTDLIAKESASEEKATEAKTIFDLELTRWGDKPREPFKFYFLLPKEFIDNKTPIREGEEVRLTFKEPEDKKLSFDAKGSILEVPNEFDPEVCVELDPLFKWKIKRAPPVKFLKGFRIKFLFNPIPFSRMIKAMELYHDQFNETILNRELNPEDGVMPDEATSLINKTMILGTFEKTEEGKQLPLRTEVTRAPNLPSLNDSQEVALLSAINNSFTLVQGPPGTGKTLVSAYIIYELFKLTSSGKKDENKNDSEEEPQKKQGLVCAGSNIAVDNIMEKTNRIKKLNVLRIESRRKERKEVMSKHKILPELSLHRKVMAKEPKLEKLYYSKGAIPRNEKELLMELKNNLEQEFINEADIIFTTCGSSADNRLDGMTFSFCLIDECGQSMEPESIIPISKTRGRVVLVGDHAQLGPVVVSDEAAEQGLNVSLFQRLVTMKEQSEDGNGVSFVRLNTQYRMNPSISFFPSKTFYEGTLKDGVTSKDRASTAFPWPIKDKNIVFIACPDGKEKDVGTSYSNRLEATYVVDVANFLIKNGLNPDKIGVITPYDGQKALLKKSPLIEYKIPEGVEVNSVDGFQGREKEMIILTCVRSEKMDSKNDTIGFLKDRRRLNVAITRARRGLIVIGNPNLLRTDDLWRDFLLHYQREGVLKEKTGDSFNDLKKFKIDLRDPVVIEKEVQENMALNGDQTTSKKKKRNKNKK